jgi:hypothetical protein
MALDRVGYYMSADRSDYGGETKKYALPVAAREDGHRVFDDPEALRQEVFGRARDDGSPGFVW